jgi:hypothetical protein
MFRDDRRRRRRVCGANDIARRSIQIAPDAVTISAWEDLKKS